jgi:hypothetical protein
MLKHQGYMMNLELHVFGLGPQLTTAEPHASTSCGEWFSEPRKIGTVHNAFWLFANWSRAKLG